MKDRNPFLLFALLISFFGFIGCHLVEVETQQSSDNVKNVEAKGAQKLQKGKDVLGSEDHEDLHSDSDGQTLEEVVEGAKPVYDAAVPDGFQLLDRSELTAAIEYCRSGLARLPHPQTSEVIKKICEHIKQEKSCLSEQGQPIFHYDRPGTSSNGKRILTISLVHGDEHSSGTISAQWIHRLEGIDPRNSWRVIPILNPDGWKLGTRTNANGVDINRNFPSKDWDELALKWWKDKKGSDPRRYPGSKAASESETRCLVQHIEEFKPDFIIAVHTPLGLLDFDGPDVRAPSSAPLPWHKLGNFPGSLGRYMWKDHKVPVLTIELRGSYGVKKLAEFDTLQDISGSVAIRAGKALGKVKN